MDTQEREDINKAYYLEYKSKAIQEMTGFSGMLMRFGDKINSKLIDWHDSRSAKYDLAMLGGALGMGMSFWAGLFAAPLVTAIIVGSGAYVIVKADREANRRTKIAVNQDIENGVLPERYAREVLQPQIEALDAKRTSLLNRGDAAKAFSKAVEVDVVSEAVAPTVTVTMRP